MFQSLTGRLQTVIVVAHSNGYPRFNPSQVGYKRLSCKHEGEIWYGFNPSQVGYKLGQHDPKKVWAIKLFQSLTGRLQTQKSKRGRRAKKSFQSLTGRLQTGKPLQQQFPLLLVSIPHR